MKKLIVCANEFVRRSDWKDMALLKVCLCAMGVLAGLSLPKKAKKPAAFAAMSVFILTYIPLMNKLLAVVLDGKSSKKE